MKVLSAGGYSQQELKGYLPIIYSNCITQMQVLICQMEIEGVEYENPDNAVSKKKNTIENKYLHNKYFFLKRQELKLLKDYPQLLIHGVLMLEKI